MSENHHTNERHRTRESSDIDGEVHQRRSDEEEKLLEVWRN